MLQYSTPALPPRLYAHAPLSERGRYVTGSRHVSRANDDGGDTSAPDDGGQMDVRAKRRRMSSDTADTSANETHSGEYARNLISIRQVSLSVHFTFFC